MGLKVASSTLLNPDDSCGGGLFLILTRHTDQHSEWKAPGMTDNFDDGEAGLSSFSSSF